MKRGKPENSNESSSEEEVVSVSYKSKKSAMPDGPQDQGATAILVGFNCSVCLQYIFMLSFLSGN